MNDTAGKTTPKKKPAAKRPAAAAKPAPAAAKRPAAKPATAKAKPAARAATPKAAAAKPTVAAPPPAAAKTAGNGKAAKGEGGKKKVRLVRDSFTMPEATYEIFAAIKARCLQKGTAAKKSEVLRAALASFAQLSDTRIVQAIAGLEPIKTGRPPKPAK